MFSENSVVFEIMWKTYCIAKQVTHENIIRRVRIVYWTTKATDTHSEYVIFTAFPLKQLLRVGVLMLCYAYTADLIRFSQEREVSDRLEHEAATLGV
jgi:hypothetical protein